MLELLISVVMTVSSVLLFCFWFRYTCRLILSAATSQDFAANVALAHHLGFQRVQEQLREGATELDGLKRMLDADYSVLANLMHQAGEATGGMERHMLEIHYQLASFRYRASAGMSASAARQALEEMSQVLAHLANSVGECACASAA